MGLLRKLFSKRNDVPTHVEKNRSAKQIMTEIYSRKKWGGKDRDFYSGAGSHSQRIVKPYIKEITEFLKGFDTSLSVCDLGCGDFNVGYHLVPYTKQYVGVDVVEELIDRNKRNFQSERLDFQCLNIVEDELPEADCVMVRQVLQHLSNSEIQSVAEKLKKYRHVIVTEHLPKGNFTPNVDKPTGANIRLSKKSGVVLTEAPFNFEPVVSRVMLNISYRSARIVTTHYQFD